MNSCEQLTRIARHINSCLECSAARICFCEKAEKMLEDFIRPPREEKKPEAA